MNRSPSAMRADDGIEGCGGIETGVVGVGCAGVEGAGLNRGYAVRILNVNPVISAVAAGGKERFNVRRYDGLSFSWKSCVPRSRMRVMLAGKSPSSNVPSVPVSVLSRKF